MITEENFDIEKCMNRRTKNHQDNYNLRDLRRFLDSLHIIYKKTAKKSDLVEDIISYLKGVPTIYDCISNGDCMFHGIAVILSSIDEKYEYTASDVRKLTAKGITTKNIDTFLEMQEIDYKNNPTDFEWKPMELKTLPKEKKVEHMRSIITTSGFLYEGDWDSLILLTKSKIFKQHKLGLILKSSNHNCIQYVPTTYKPELYGILYNLSNIHWQIFQVYIDKERRFVFTKSEVKKYFDKEDSDVEKSEEDED